MGDGKFVLKRLSIIEKCPRYITEGISLFFKCQHQWNGYHR